MLRLPMPGVCFNASGDARYIGEVGASLLQSENIRKYLVVELRNIALPTMDGAVFCYWRRAA